MDIGLDQGIAYVNRILLVKWFGHSTSRAANRAGGNFRPLQHLAIGTHPAVVTKHDRLWRIAYPSLPVKNLMGIRIHHQIIERPHILFPYVTLSETKIRRKLAQEKESPNSSTAPGRIFIDNPGAKLWKFFPLIISLPMMLTNELES